MKAKIGSFIVSLFSIFYRFYKPVLRRGNLFIRTDASFISGTVRSAMVLGLQERAEKLMVKKYLKSGVPVLEFGSSLGSVTLEIVAKIGNYTPIVSVEANPVLAGWMAEQVRSSGRENHQVLNFAIAGSEVEHVFFKIDSGSLGSCIVDSEGDDIVVVKATKIADIIREVQFGSFAIVCDIEGAEFSAFSGVQGFMDGCEVLIIELHPPVGEKVDELFCNLESQGLNFVERHRDVFVFVRTGQ